MGFFGAFLLFVLGCAGTLYVARIVQLRARGISVVTSRRNKPAGEAWREFLLGVSFWLWAFEAVAYAWPLPVHVFPAPLDALLIEWIGFRVLGAAVLAAGLAIYVLGIASFGESWRLGIDRVAHGPLVTRGIFAWVRNPVFLALDLFAIGSFLVLGRLVLLILAGLLVLAFHLQIRCEEAFLEELCGEPYRDYLRRVPRYLPWRGRHLPGRARGPGGD